MSDVERDARCSRCGAPFRCGAGDPGGCWCARLPALPRAAIEKEASCLCPECLAAQAARARTGARCD